MDKKEYLISAYMDFILNAGKEELSVILKPIIEATSLKLLEEIILKNEYKIKPYYVIAKDELVDKFMNTSELEIRGLIEYDSWQDPEYNFFVGEDNKKFLDNIIYLILYLYNNNELELAYKLIRHLYEIRFDCKYEDLYDDSYYDCEEYHFSDVFPDLDTHDFEDEVRKINVMSLIYFKSYDELIKMLSYYENDQVLNIIYENDFDFLNEIGHKIVKEKIDFRYHLLFEKINDYNLYNEYLIQNYQNNPEAIMSFIKLYKNVDGAFNVIKSLLLSFNDIYYRNEKVYYEIMSERKDKDLILNYYLKYDNSKSFIIFNNLEDDIFYKNIKEKDKKNLNINSNIINSDYDYFKYLIKAIYKTNIDNDLIKSGSEKYLKRAKINKEILNISIINYVLEEGESYSYKKYSYYVDLIINVLEDINYEINLKRIVKEYYKARRKLVNMLGADNPI